MVHQKKLFSKEECEKIISYKSQKNDLKKWYISEAEITDNRVTIADGNFKYETHIIIYNDETSWIFERICNWFTEVTGVELIRPPKSFSIHRYEIGDYFKKHIDLGYVFKKRRYNLGVQLSENYEGGDYLWWDNYGKEYKISREIGTALTYHASIEHEITEITKGERWSVVMIVENHIIKEKPNLI